MSLRPLCGIPEEKLVVLRWRVVHAAVALIDAVLLNRENDKAAALVGVRVKIHVGLADGINPAARNHVTREWQASLPDR